MKPPFIFIVSYYSSTRFQKLMSYQTLSTKLGQYIYSVSIYLVREGVLEDLCGPWWQRCLENYCILLQF